MLLFTVTGDVNEDRVVDRIEEEVSIVETFLVVVGFKSV